MKPELLNKVKIGYDIEIDRDRSICLNNIKSEYLLSWNSEQVQNGIGQISMLWPYD